MMLRTAVPPEQPGLEAPTERLYLTASVVLGKTYPASLYSPPSGLFKTFAGLSTERDQIVGFANKWGMLTAGDPVLLNESSIGFGELFELWETEIRDLSFAVRIWDLLNSGDGVALSRYIKWKDDSQVWFARPADEAASPRDSSPPSRRPAAGCGLGSRPRTPGSG